MAGNKGASNARLGPDSEVVNTVVEEPGADWQGSGPLRKCISGYTIIMYIKEDECRYRSGEIASPCGYPRL
jgi:hypothetical protein